MTEETSILSATEARILASLMEKQQTTPEQYPLTQNSLMLACNQKSSREPQMSLTEGEVGHCLRQLEGRKLIRVDMGARSYRYDHGMSSAYLIDKKMQAILAVMMLRGPQTLNELYTRTQRTGVFENIEDITDSLARMTDRSVPIVKLIPKQAGQREDRYAHLLCGEPDITVIKADPTPRSSAKSSQLGDLEQRVLELEQRVSELEKMLTE